MIRFFFKIIILIFIKLNKYIIIPFKADQPIEPHFAPLALICE